MVNPTEAGQDRPETLDTKEGKLKGQGHGRRRGSLYLF